MAPGPGLTKLNTSAPQIFGKPSFIGHWSALESIQIGCSYEIMKGIRIRVSGNVMENFESQNTPYL